MDTDTSIAEFMKLARSHPSTWELVDEGANFKTYLRTIEPKSTSCIRFEAEIEGVTTDIAIKSVEDVRCRKYWDFRMTHWEVVE